MCIFIMLQYIDLTLTVHYFLDFLGWPVILLDQDNSILWNGVGAFPRSACCSE